MVETGSGSADRLEWQVHLLRRRPAAGALVSLGTLAGAAVAWAWFGSPALAVFVVLVTVASLAAFFFPIRYSLSARGVRMYNFIGREDRRWEEFANYHVYPDGVQLAFSRGTIRGRMLKGIFLYFEGNRDQVLAMVRDRMAAVRAAATASHRQPGDG